MDDRCARTTASLGRGKTEACGRAFGRWRPEDRELRSLEAEGEDGGLMTDDGRRMMAFGP
jgi:hypothetical protein